MSLYSIVRDETLVPNIVLGCKYFHRELEAFNSELILKRAFRKCIILPLPFVVSEQQLIKENVSPNSEILYFSLYSPPLLAEHYILENKLIAKRQIGFTPTCRATKHFFMLKTLTLVSKYVKDKSGKL